MLLFQDGVILKIVIGGAYTQIIYFLGVTLLPALVAAKVMFYSMFYNLKIILNNRHF